MSKNIVIAEGRRGRRMGATKKLRTKLQGGGDCLWVPEDDVQLDSLYAYENGVYRPEQYGFDQASINVVDATLTPLDTGLNVPLFPPAGTDGFSKVTVNVPASEQDTYMDAIQWKCLPMPSDKPYMWTIFNEIERSDETLGDKFRTRATITFQSSFPPFVYGSVDTGDICGFVRGDNSLRATLNWEHWRDHQPSGTYLDQAYLNDCVIDFADDFSVNARGYGTAIVRSKRVDGEDILEFGGTPRSRLVSVGDHLGVPLATGVGSTFFKQDSEPEELTPGGTTRQVVGVTPPRNNGYYSYNYWTTTDTMKGKVINGKSFATMEEWLNWCKTH